MRGFIGILTLALSHSSVLAQAPAKPAELKVLERYIGKWKFEATARVAEWNPKETKYSGTSSNEWVLDGRFQHHKVKFDDGTEGIDIMTYDADKKAYRNWSFRSTGFTSETAGEWDEKSKTMTMKEMVGEVTIVTSMRFVDNDNREMTVVARDAAGKLYIDTHGKLSRTK